MSDFSLSGCGAHEWEQIGLTTCYKSDLVFLEVTRLHDVRGFVSESWKLTPTDVRVLIGQLEASMDLLKRQRQEYADNQATTKWRF